MGPSILIQAATPQPPRQWPVMAETTTYTDGQRSSELINGSHHELIEIVGVIFS